MSQTIDVSNAVAPVKQRRRWQFGIKSVLILMTLCCAFFACCAFPPLAIIGLMLAGVCLFVGCLIAAFYGIGWIRPFGILCGTSLLIGFLMLMASNPPGPVEVAIMLAILMFLSVVIGFFGAAVHGFLRRRVGIVPIPNVPFLRDWLYNPEPKPFEV
jgi:uncharacterized membrane protein YgdD (TMEM256/DUF423 family)